MENENKNIIKKRSKYLGQLIKEKGITIRSKEDNMLVLSPCGSGKTHFILHDLVNQISQEEGSTEKKILYLCDTSNLKTQVNFDINKANIPSNVNMETMTYNKFGREIALDDNDDYINQFEAIICDEIHNLVDYETFDENKYLYLAFNKLIGKYDNTQILMFTGTPYYLQKLVDNYEDLGKNFLQRDFLEDVEIKRYINKRLEYINHISQVQLQLKAYEESFRYTDMKCMIYTQKIESMKTIEQMCKDKDLSVICVWSEHNQDNPMTEEQLKVKNTILKEGMICDEYQVVILNRAFESGINIYDERIKLFICNTLNITQQVQSRARLRFDVDFVVLKTNEDDKKPTVILEDKYLDRFMTKEQIEEEIIKPLNFRNKNGVLITVKKLMIYLEDSNYTVEKTIKRINKVRKTVWKLTKIENEDKNKKEE